MYIPHSIELSTWNEITDVSEMPKIKIKDVES